MIEDVSTKTCFQYNNVHTVLTIQTQNIISLVSLFVDKFLKTDARLELSQQLHQLSIIM